MATTTQGERAKGTGSCYQECSAKAGCPPVESIIGADGKARKGRPPHPCKGRWIASVEAGWRRNGTRRTIRRVAKSETHARKLVRQLLQESASGSTEASTSTTVKTWAERWIAQQQRTLGPSTWANHASHIRVWIVPTIGHRRLDLLTPGDIRAVQNAVLDAGRKGSTACRVDALLKQLLVDAQIEGHGVAERVLKVSPPTMSESTRGDVPLDVAVKILATALATPEDGIRDGRGSRWAAAFLQALRPAEARGLTWACVDFGRHEIDISWQLKPLPYQVRRDPTSGFRVPTDYVAQHLVGAYHLVRPKTSAGRRIIPMLPWMEAELLALREHAPDSPYDLVWPRSLTLAHPERKGWPRNPVADRDEWKALCGKAGVAEYDLYSCRHTTATLLREAGVPDDVIVAIMGHTSIKSTRPYLHPDQRAKMMEALGLVAGRLQIEG